MSLISNNASSVLHTGLQGYQNGAAQVTEAAQEIATAHHGAENGTSITSSAVDLMSGSLQAQASAKVIAKSDDMIGTLLDTFA